MKKQWQAPYVEELDISMTEERNFKLRPAGGGSNGSVGRGTSSVEQADFSRGKLNTNSLS